MPGRQAVARAEADVRPTNEVVAEAGDGATREWAVGTRGLTEVRDTWPGEGRREAAARAACGWV